MKLHLFVLVVTCCLPLARAQSSYGAGTAGTSGVVPTLTCGQAWLGNAAFALDANEGLGGAIGFVGMSFQPASGLFQGANLNIDLTPGQLALARLLILSGPAGVPGAGSASMPFSLAIPVNPALVGLELFAQLAVDEGAGSWSSSAGLAITITMPPRILVGTSVSGNNDPFYVVDPTGPALTMAAQFNVAGGSVAPINNCQGVGLADNGLRAFAAQSIGTAVQEIDLGSNPPTWSQFYAATGATYGIGVDEQAQRVYTLETTAGLGSELVALDFAAGSPTYGQQLASTTGLSSSGLIERWALSPDGRRAAVLSVLGRRLLLVDTDINSAGYMSWTLAGTAPANQGVFPVTTRCTFTPDGRQILIAIQTGGGAIGEIARYDVTLGQWIDHDPATLGVQNIGTQSAPVAQVPAAPASIAVSGDGSFAVVVGWGGTGGIARIDLDPANVQNWGFTLFSSPVSLANVARGCAISPDTRQVATFGSGQLLLFDTASGALQAQFVLPGTASISTLTWQ